jgi:hypothetical protein
VPDSQQPGISIYRGDMFRFGPSTLDGTAPLQEFETSGGADLLRSPRQNLLCRYRGAVRMYNQQLISVVRSSWVLDRDVDGELLAGIDPIDPSSTTIKAMRGRLLARVSLWRGAIQELMTIRPDEGK